MARKFSLYLILTISVFLQFCANQKKASSKANFEDALLWKITGNGINNPSYLFGTIHIMCKGDMPITSSVKQALAESNEVYMEVNLTDTVQMMTAIGSMMMKDGQKLSNLLSKEKYQTLSDEFKSYGLGLGSLERMQPLLISGMVVPKWLNCAEQSGVELEILNWAKQENKKINGLETLAEQLEIFSGISYQKQAEELYKTLTDDSQKEKMKVLYQAYLNQKLSMVAKIMNSDPQMEEFKEMLLSDRNRNWVSQLDTILPTKSVFVAVGAGHLLETDGLIALLRQKGYTVEPIIGN